MNKNAINNLDRFMGEPMTCLLCQRKEKSDLHVESNWRYIETDGDGIYVCPDHLPPDDADSDVFKDAYVSLFRIMIARKNGAKKLAERLIRHHVLTFG